MIMSQPDSPTAGFRPFFNPATGEWITYTAIRPYYQRWDSRIPGAD